MPDGQLLIPATQAAWKLGVTRRTLRKYVQAGLLRSVKMGSRTHIPQSEIDRIVKSEPVRASAPKPGTADSVSGDSTKAYETGQNGADRTAKSPRERLNDLLEGCADFMARYDAGDAVADAAAAGSPDECARAKEAFASVSKRGRE